LRTSHCSPGSELSARRYLTIALLIAGSIAYPALAADTADEARTMSRQVSTLIKSRNLGEAEALAKRGLALCDDAVGVRGFCLGQFNDWLGDIAYIQGQYPASILYYERGSEARKGILGSGNVLVFTSQMRLGRSYLAARRLDEAEPLLKSAVAGLSRVAPSSADLGLGFRFLKELYLASGQLDEEVTATRREVEFHEKYSGNDAQAILTAKIFLNTVLFRQARQLSGKNNNIEAEQILVEAIKLVDPPQPGTEKYLGVSLEELGVLYDKLHRYAEAEPIMLRALEYRTKFSEPSDPNLPILLINLAVLYQNWGKPEASIPYATRAILKLEEAKAENSTLGHVLSRLGSAYKALGQTAEAERSFIRARNIFDRVLPEADPQRVVIRFEMGELYLSQEKYADAEKAYQAALSATQKLAKSDTAWRSSVLAELGLTYREQARYEDAERSLLEAVRLEEAVGNERKPLLGQRLTLLASIYRRQNRYADAEATLLRALKLEQPVLDRAATLNALGLVYTTIDQYEKAEPPLNEALAIRKSGLPADSAPTLETISNLATVDSARGRYTDAEAKFRHVLKATDVAGQTQSTAIALQSLLLAQVLVSEGKLDEADALVQRSLDLYRQQLGPNHPRFGNALKTLASIEALRGSDRNAETHYDLALAIDEKVIGPKSPAVAADLMSLVPLLKRAGKRQNAKASIERALAINIAQFGPDSPMTADVIFASANMAYEEGRNLDARQLAGRARQIRERAFRPEHYSLAGSWILAARLDIALGKLDDASANLNLAADITAKALPPSHFSNIDVLEGKADVARALGKLSDVEQHTRDALAIAEKQFEPDYPVRRNAIDRLTGALWVQGKFADAERLQRDELGNIELKRGPDHPSTAIAIRGVASVLGSSGHQGEAIELYRRALAINGRSFGPQSDQSAWDHFALGSLLRRMGQFEDARIEINLAKNAWESQGRVLAANSSLEQLALLALGQGSPAEGVVFLERMLNVTEQAFGSDSPALAAMLAQLGSVYVIAGRNDAAEKILARITGLIGDNPPEQAPGYLNLLQLRAQLSAEHGNISDAEAGFIRAIAIAAKYGGPQNSTVGNNSFNLAVVYLKAGRFREAIDYYVKALDIFKRENGDRAPIVGYTLIGAAQAYEKMGDQKSAKALSAAAIEILGPTIAVKRPQPRWL
jgi:tetratricopeptide (TPR) repeat protein